MLHSCRSPIVCVGQELADLRPLRYLNQLVRISSFPNNNIPISDYAECVAFSEVTTGALTCSRAAAIVNSLAVVFCRGMSCSGRTRHYNIPTENR